MWSYVVNGRCDDGEGATRSERLVTSCSWNGSPRLSSQYRERIGARSKDGHGSGDQIAPGVAIRACCEAIAHE